MVVLHHQRGRIRAHSERRATPRGVLCVRTVTVFAVLWLCQDCVVTRMYRIAALSALPLAISHLPTGTAVRRPCLRVNKQ